MNMTSLLFLIILIMSGIYIMLNFLMENYVLSFINTRLLMPDNLKIDDVTLDKLNEKSSFVLLVGMGGIGKSMMMRHLFLSSIKKYTETGLLPILITLREFGSENQNLFSIVADSVHRFDITFSLAHLDKLMEEGKCQLLLDGLDEIKSADMRSFQKQLDSLIDRYPKWSYL